MASNIVDKSKKRYLEYEKRHQEILEVAIGLFNAKGYKATTTAEIASEANISEPTMYKHFTNKKELFLECYRSIIVQLFQEYRKVYKSTQDDEVGYLKGVSKAYIDFLLENPDKSMFLIQLLSYRDEPEFEKTYREYMETSIERVKTIISSAKKKGTIKSEIDDRVLSGMFVTQIMTAVVLKELIDPNFFTDEIFFQVLSSMLGITE
jgi:AcrR family transcriptional regulator